MRPYVCVSMEARTPSIAGPTCPYSSMPPVPRRPRPTATGTTRPPTTRAVCSTRSRR
ncbi:hypothetical protein [Lysobacter gummosus]|uniref:hypothetical protein n=1 Tax=Lysobacter gummosus TaxID=262324 RepID=UPI00363A181B